MKNACAMPVLAPLLVLAIIGCHGVEGGTIKTMPGQRGNSVVLHRGDGWFYHRNQVRGNLLHLRCIHFKKGCKGTAVIDRLERDLVHMTAHNGHGADRLHTQVQALRRRILSRCRRLEYVSYRVLFNQERRGVPRTVRARLPYARIRTAMRNARFSRYPNPLPRTLRELTEVLRDPRFRVITMTDDGEDNIYAASVDDVSGHHSVIFASQRMLEFMSKVRILHGDGTFKVVPCINGVSQVFVIVTTWRYHIIPLAWILMERRTQHSYEAVLREIFNRLPRPVMTRRVITDYERGQQNAWSYIFQCQMQGCLWHLCRAFVSEAIVLGLGVHLRNTPFIRRIIRLCCALPLLPKNDIPTGYFCIVREAMTEGPAMFRLLRPFFRYLQHFWILDRSRLDWMSVYRSFHRTNNASESHNRVIRDLIGRNQNIFRFIDGLVTLEAEAYSDILILENAEEAAGRPRSLISLVNDRQIERLEEDIRNPVGRRRDAILNFLQAASHRLEDIMDNALDDHRQ